MKKTISLVLVLALGLATGVANADFIFGEPTNLGPTVNSTSYDANVEVSADGLVLFFSSGRPGGHGESDLWVSTRATTDDEWGAPVNVSPPVNSSHYESGPSISVDGLCLYFDAVRPGGYGDRDIWVTMRETADYPWGEPVNLGPTVNTSYYDGDPEVSSNGLSLFFHSTRSGGYGGEDLWVSTRPTLSDPWGTPMNLGSTINNSYYDGDPDISADGLVLFFSSGRPGGHGNYDIWVTTRATKDDDWGTPENLGRIVNSLVDDATPSLSADGSTLHFSRGQIGTLAWDLWQAPIIPIVDFNGDGIVDCDDMCIIVDHWGTDNSLCDIGPAPFGDGIIDVLDLVALTEHFFTYPGAVAYWALDETEGDIASDSANDNDGTVYGDPAWQPEGGMVDGALQLDGIDDYVSTPFVLNPADGKFSVFVWIKGGAPGQAVLSQIGGVNWLCADTLEGNLMTELKATGRGAAILLSQSVITDDNWHRIGLVWDGSHRTLYVDDVAVAEDTQANLGGSDNGLYIGAGTAMETGSFWSGLIDDVRIYNRAVTP